MMMKAANDTGGDMGPGQPYLEELAASSKAVKLRMLKLLIKNTDQEHALQRLENALESIQLLVCRT